MCAHDSSCGWQAALHATGKGGGLPRRSHRAHRLPLGSFPWHSQGNLDLISVSLSQNYFYYIIISFIYLLKLWMKTVDDLKELCCHLEKFLDTRSKYLVKWECFCDIARCCLVTNEERAIENSIANGWVISSRQSLLDRVWILDLQHHSSIWLKKWLLKACTNRTPVFQLVASSGTLLALD